MRILAKAGREDIALVYVAESSEGKLIEFCESLQPPLPRDKKWVLLISTLYGCPVGCSFCDAGGGYDGKIKLEDMLSQIDFLVKERFPDGKIPVEKFKIQFSRMGEPSFNDEVLDLIEIIPNRYDAPGFIPSLSTVAPRGQRRFFERLLEIKRKYYSDSFQLQFSLHSTDERMKNKLVPAETLSFSEMADYGKSFYEGGEKKIILNFALAADAPVDAGKLLKHFSPDIFLVKMTPVNPTYRAVENGIISGFDSESSDKIIQSLRLTGYEVIKSVGEPEENLIGSNCGQYINAYKKAQKKIRDTYTYDLQIIG